MKKFLIFTILFFIFASSAKAEKPTTVSVEQAISGYYQQPNPVKYSSCIKTYQIHAAELFQRLLAAISASKSKSSSIIF